MGAVRTGVRGRCMSRGLSLAGCHEVFSIPGLRPFPLPTTLSRAAGGHHEGDPRNDPRFRNPSWLCGWFRISPATPPSIHWPPILAVARRVRRVHSGRGAGQGAPIVFEQIFSASRSAPSAVVRRPARLYRRADSGRTGRDTGHVPAAARRGRR